MKPHIITIILLLVVLLTSCEQEQPLECGLNQEIIDGICVDLQDDSAQQDIDNPVLLNTGNNEGWTFFTNYKATPVMDVRNGRIQFTQADNTEDTTWARKFMYDTLSFQETMQYTISFTLQGTEHETVQVQLYASPTVLLVDETLVLDGSNQTIEFSFQTRETVVGSGIFVLGLGTFKDGSTMTISDIHITEEEHIPTVINVLFIGNSFTYYNDMPTMFEHMSTEAGYQVHIEQIAYGGYQLSRYVALGTEANQEVVDALERLDWDFVILQEQSAKPATNKTDFLLSVAQLDQLIDASGAQTVLYSTWSYRDGSTKLDNTGYTYTEFYQAITSSYQQAEQANDAIRVPVGTVFYNISMDGSPINLITIDDFHPTPEGSYVAAFSFFTVLLGTDHEITYTPTTITSEERDLLQTYVLDVINPTN